MLRCICIVGLILAALVAFQRFMDDTADDSPEVTNPPVQLAQQPGGRLDPERLQKLREKFANNSADISNLKRMTWSVGGDTREALVYIPTNVGKSPPIVFAFHGHGGRAEYAAKKFDVHDLWPEAICVYPQGLPTAVPKIDPDGKMPGWQKYIGDEKDRDLEFFDAMLKSMKADHGIDEKRVFVAGHSNGGFFTYVLWAARGDEIAAVAPVAATLNLQDLKMMKPKPVLHVAGEKDPIVPFQGQQRTIDADRKINGCDADGKPDGKFCTEYTSKSGPPVVAFIHPGGHEIPEGAAARIVAFFKQNSLAAQP